MIANKFLCLLIKIKGKNTNTALKQLQAMPKQYCQDCGGLVIFVINKQSFIARKRLKNKTRNCCLIKPTNNSAKRLKNVFRIYIFLT